MRNGAFRTELLLLVCGMLLLPLFCQAGSVKIPGYNGSSIASVAPATRAALPASQSSVTINLPGFYGPTVTPPAPNALPTNPQIVQGVSPNGIVENSANNQLTIQQDQPQAIINWSSFNIGANATVTFDQKTVYQQLNGTNNTGYTNWVALNRIFDNNPSMIFGKLTADGKIYLINQNGILFGPGSTVNVNSLIASALDIKDTDFLSGSLNFFYDGNGFSPFTYINASGNLVTVSNLGQIDAGNGGYVFLIGPRAENVGLINAPAGQIGLAAGTSVTLLPPGINDTRSSLYVLINDDFSHPVSSDPTFGEAVNQEGGQLFADGGIVGIYGNNVNQLGAIRSMTAFENNPGQVELMAASQITTGANSSISLPVNPSTTETISDTFNIQPIVSIGGLWQPATCAGCNPTVPTPVTRIELMGTITAPTGQVSLNAVERVYMATGSSIDVSGVVADLPVPVISNYKLSSVDLRDDDEQKAGLLLDQPITTSVESGSSIGDLSQVILTRDRTALERCVGGAMTQVIDPTTGAISYQKQDGQISINVANGNIIVEQGATLNFSGGAIHYTGGAADTTQLLSGTRIYNISNAPLNIQYDEVVSQYERTYSRFGVNQSYSGLYYGGASPLGTYVNGYTQGGDAGQLTLTASHVVLDGQLNGSVTRGIYQNTWTTTDPTSEIMALSVDRGLEVPRAGTLTIGNIQNTFPDTTAISVVTDTSPQQQLSGATQLSAKMLNDANLGTINLYADTVLSIAQGVSIQLQPGGSFSATARRIEEQGEITIPSGTISLITAQNSTSQLDVNGEPQASYVPLSKPEMIVLRSGSHLDVSGEKINNTPAGQLANPTPGTGQMGGGTINIKDETDLGQGVDIQTGAVVDVSGGYTIDAKGNVTGGNAGQLAIQGLNITLNGDLRGYALADPKGNVKGGSIILTARDIHVVSSSPPWYLADSGEFYFVDNSLDNTGFTRITLKSIDNIVMDSNTTITTSLVRLNNPSTSQGPAPVGSPLPGQPDLISLDESNAYMAGPSSFTAIAGSYFEGYNSHLIGNLKATPDTPNVNAQIMISQGAEIQTAPGTSSVTSNISLTAPFVDVAGTLAAPAGNITVASTGLSGSTNSANLTLENSAQLLAGGYNQPDPASTPKGFAVNYQPVNGGSVTLSATGGSGNMSLDANSIIDVSGSAPVENTVQTSNSGLYSYTAASNPGRLSLNFSGNLTWTGTSNDAKPFSAINARAKMNGIQGGTLSISNTTIGNSGFIVSGDDMNGYITSGFDDITLKSWSSIQFSGSIQETIGRKLTLDAPAIMGSNNDEVSLQAPWIVVTNTNPSSTSPPLSTSSPTGTAQLTLASQWIDVIGTTQFSGFQNVRLQAARDIQLSEALYSGNNPIGTLSTTGNLTLDADRIYPGNYYSNVSGSNVIYPDIYSDYTIQANGKVTVLHSAAPVGGPTYSAGGSLTVIGDQGIEIDNGGYLAAPLGSISLSAPGQRIYLAAGSVLTTAGNTEVLYGGIDSNNVWVTEDKSGPTGFDSSLASSFNSGSLPQKGVSLNADTIIAMQGSEINVSGGGSVFTYKFEPSVQGSNDPLAQAGSYVVFKDNSFQMPGQAIYLTGGGGLSAGSYTLLPLGPNDPQNARYAFMPGAYILELQTGTALPGSGQPALSQNGYPLTVGYLATSGTSLQSTQPQVYTVQTAGEVLTEGQYLQPIPVLSGGAGNISISGNTAIVNSILNAAAIGGQFQGGLIALNGASVYVQGSNVSLPSTFGFGTDVPGNLSGLLTITSSSLSGQGFREIDLGNQTTTSVTIMGGSVLAAPIISLTANNMITIGSGAQLNAVAQNGQGEINLTSPSGSATIQAGALLHASQAIDVNVGNPDIQGNLQIDQGGALTLQASNIFFVPAGYTSTSQGLYLTDSLWNQFRSNDITLISQNNLTFEGESFALSANRSVSIDAASIVGLNAGVSLTASTIHLSYSGTGSTSASTAPVSTNAGQITFNGDTISVGSGNVQFAGFQGVTFNSHGDLTLMGQGSLTTGNANLNISAARMTTASTSTTVTNTDGTTSTPVVAANFQVDAGTGTLNITSSGGAAGTASVPGGMLEFLASKIDLSSVVEMTAGTIQMIASGSGQNGGISLHNGGQILARGNDQAPGGQVTLQTDSGSITMEEGSVIDVSAGAQGDAGTVTLQALNGGITLKGDNNNLMGKAQGGIGGSLVFYTQKLGDQDMATLMGTIKRGGFTESLDIRTQSGDVNIDSGTTVQAHSFTLTADAGNIDVEGNINASAAEGGSEVDLYASGNVTLGGKIDVSGTKGDANGGDVLLSSENGFVNLNKGSSILASGSGAGQGGVVHLRALRYTTKDNLNDVQMNLNGTIQGESSVIAEAVRVYDGVSNIYLTAPQDPTQRIASAGYISDWQTDTNTYMANATTIINRLQSGSLSNLSGKLQLVPGIEVDNTSGDITLNDPWLLQGSLNGVEAGALTLRASGNIVINNTLADAPTVMSGLNSHTASPSWAFNLTAGADFSSANYLAVVQGQGDLTIAGGAVVYTENAPIRFASGNDTVIGYASPQSYMINSTIGYNLASYSGSIQGYVGRDLNINGGAIQTATGEININVGRDIDLGVSNGALGTIRTTGEDPTATGPSTNYWQYTNGGNINLEVGRYVGNLNSSGQWVTALSSSKSEWDNFTLVPVPGVSNPRAKNDGIMQFSANYTAGTAGLATMGGGNLTVRTGGDFLAQAGTFGAGNLTIYSGGDIKGRFLSMDGQGQLNAMGNFGSADERQQIELFASQMTVTAMGDIQIAAVLNPSLASDNPQLDTVRSAYFENCTYTPNSSITLNAGGNVTIAGTSPFYTNNASYPDSATLYETILPASVSVTAGGNIYLLNNFTLTSSSLGNLILSAKENISGSYSQTGAASILMSDIAQDYWYGPIRIANNQDELNGGWLAQMTYNNHGYFRAQDAAKQAVATPLHENDSQPVEIQAGNDIENLQLSLPKKAEVTAGANIVGLIYEGQNINPTDVSMIRAVGNITESYLTTAETTSSSSSTLQQPHDGIIQGGPGVFLVQAGGSIDLGTLQDGIQAVGNGNDSLLSAEKSTLLVVSGYTFDKTAADISIFFDKIREAGGEYAKLEADGQLAAGAKLLQLTREKTIIPFLGTPSGTGDIDMTSSQITTSIGKSDIYVIANGTLDLGKTALPISGTASATTGIATGGGGDINVYSRLDINVNESRVMTFYGGDITVWSDQGNINAGRGSKTAVSATPPRRVQTAGGGYAEVFTPPAIGSGIRAVTYGLNPPPPGNIFLFAPSGIINAGEAGISGGEVILAAVQVLNVSNISFSAGSIGVPKPVETSGIGTLSGTGAVAQSAQLTSDVAGIAAANAAQASKMIEDIMAKWLDVQVIDFVQDEDQ